MPVPTQPVKESYFTTDTDTTDMVRELVADKNAALPTTTDESAGEEYPLEKTPQPSNQGECPLCVLIVSMFMAYRGDYNNLTFDNFIG